MDEVFIITKPSIEAVHLIARNLCHEVAVRIFAYAAAPDLSCRNILEKQDVTSGQTEWCSKFI